MKFHDTVENAKAEGKIELSRQMKQLSKSDSNYSPAKQEEALQKLVSGDFGTIRSNPENFTRRLNSGKRDVYGIYGDMVIYYDADENKIYILTKEEFLTQYQRNWDKDDEITGFNTLYKGYGGAAKQNLKERGGFLKLGQEREIRQSQREEGGKFTATQSRLGFKVFPHEDYSKVVAVLGPDRMAKLKQISQEQDINMAKLLQYVGYNHYVQHKNTQNSYEWALKAAGYRKDENGNFIKVGKPAPALLTKDSKKVVKDQDKIEYALVDDDTQTILAEGILQNIIEAGKKAIRREPRYLKTKNDKNLKLWSIDTETGEVVGEDDYITFIYRMFGKKALFDSDPVEKAPDYTKETKDGYKIIQALKNEDDRKFVIVKRPNDFAFGAGYDVEDGTWAAGYYGFESEADAKQAIYHNYPDDRFKTIKL